jgi:hypothetical protein
MFGDIDVTRRDFVRGTATAALAWSLLGKRTAEAATPTWSLLETPTAPPARGDHALVYDAVGDRVLLFGGRGETDYNDVWSLNVASGEWVELSATGTLPAPRFTPNGFFDPSSGRLIAGFGQGNSFFNDVWAFDPVSLTWTQLGMQEQDRPARRYGAAHAFDAAQSRLIISHGFTDNGRFDDTWVFDLGTEQWTEVETSEPLPLKRCLVRGGWDPAAQTFMIFGGQSNPRAYRDDLWLLDLDSARWTRNKSLPRPTPRNLYAACFDEALSRWLIFGGETKDGFERDLWSYGTALTSWERLRTDKTKPSRRRSGETVLAGERLVLFGGYNKKAGWLADTWVLDFN